MYDELVKQTRKWRTYQLKEHVVEGSWSTDFIHFFLSILSFHQRTSSLFFLLAATIQILKSVFYSWLMFCSTFLGFFATFVRGFFNEIKAVHMREAINLLVNKIPVDKVRMFNEVVREMCVLWFCYISAQPSIW